MTHDKNGNWQLIDTHRDLDTQQRALTERLSAPDCNFFGCLPNDPLLGNERPKP